MDPTPQYPVQMFRIYQRMSEEARYRPSAPSDGMGNITVPLAELDLEAEAVEYARHWWNEEEHGRYTIGCPDMTHRAALVFLVEAARNLCGMNTKGALRLTQMALDFLEADQERKKNH